jgi:transposase
MRRSSPLPRKELSAVPTPPRRSLLFEVFLWELRKAYPSEQIVLVLDGAPGHRSGRVSWPEGIEALPLPPYSPELNPVERLFEELRAKLSNMIFTSVEAMRWEH